MITRLSRSLDRLHRELLGCWKRLPLLTVALVIAGLGVLLTSQSAAARDGAILDPLPPNPTLMLIEETPDGCVSLTPMSGFGEAAQENRYQSMECPYASSETMVDNLPSGIEAVPPPPLLVSPSNQSRLNTLIPILKINTTISGVETSVRYEYSLNSSFSPWEGMGVAGTRTTPEWSFPLGEGYLGYNLQPNTRYYWHARTGYGNWKTGPISWGPYSPTWSFTTGSNGTILSGPELVSPPNNSDVYTLRPTLQWRTLPEAREFFAVAMPVGGGSGYGWGCSDCTSESVQFWVDLPLNSSWDWWVRLRNDYAWGAKSSVWRFSVRQASISGRITDANGNGISGITVSDNAEHNASTDTSGNYTLTGLSAGSYTLTPSKSGYTFCPRSRPTTVSANQSNQNFSGSASGTDLGFCPEPDGFKFANKQLWRTWPMFEQFYGPDQVRQADGSICGTAQLYFNQTYRGVANGWSCFGFTLGSLHSYQNRSQPNAGPYAIAHYDRLYDQTESSQLTDPIAYYSGAQLSRQFADEYGAWLTTCDQDSSQMVERVRQAFQSSNALLLGLNAGNVYHAITPYRVVTISADETDLYVYDNDAPGQQRIVRFLRTGGIWQWRYTFIGSLSSAGTRTGGCHDMYYYQAASSVERGKPLVNLCGGTGLAASSDASGVTNSDRLLGVLPATGDWILQDSLGRRLGWISDQWIAEIPDAYELPQTFGDGTPSYRALYLPSGSYTIQASATSNRQIDYSLFADGKVLEVSGKTSSSDGTSQISVTPAFDAISVTHPADLTVLALDVTRELSAASRVAGLRSNLVSGTDDLQMRFDGERMQVARADGELQYTVSFQEIGGTGGYFISEPVTLHTNEAHALHPSDWNGLTVSTVVLDIDQGQDGTIDETRILTNQVRRSFLPVVLAK
jgi:hypothetical protein